jgi:hypothetical protein
MGVRGPPCGYRRQPSGGHTPWIQTIRSSLIEGGAHRAVVVDYSPLEGVMVLFVVVAIVPFVLLLSIGFGYAVFALGARGADDVATFIGSTLIAGYLGALLLAELRGTFVRRFLALSPAGIHHRGRHLEAFFPWDDIRFVLAATSQGHHQTVTIGTANALRMKVRDRRVIRLRRLPAEPRTNSTLPAGALAVDPAIVYYGIRFYHEHPKLRSELAHEAGAERFRQANFPLANDEPSS